MKFLLNMNLPPQLGSQLNGEGHLCRHVRDIGMATAEDIDLVEEAKLQEEVILTHDLDYGHLLAFSGDAKPSVVIFRLRNTHPKNLFARFMTVWSRIETELRDGAVVVIEDSAIRIRNLPIVTKNN